MLHGLLIFCDKGVHKPLLIGTEWKPPETEARLKGKVGVVISDRLGGLTTQRRITLEWFVRFGQKTEKNRRFKWYTCAPFLQGTFYQPRPSYNAQSLRYSLVYWSKLCKRSFCKHFYFSVSFVFLHFACNGDLINYRFVTWIDSTFFKVVISRPTIRWFEY